MKYLYLLLAIALLSSCASNEPKTGVFVQSNPSFYVYPMKSPSDNSMLGKHYGYEKTMEETAKKLCQSDYEFFKSEMMLDSRNWGMKVVSIKTGKSQVFACSKVFNPTN